MPRLKRLFCRLFNHRLRLWGSLNGCWASVYCERCEVATVTDSGMRLCAHLDSIELLRGNAPAAVVDAYDRARAKGASCPA